VSNTIKQKVKLITYHPKDRMGIFRKLSIPEQEAVFEIISPHVQQNILERLKSSEIIDLLDQMDMQRAGNTLPRIKNKSRRIRIISRLKSDLREKAEYFLRFHPKAAINLLNFNYLFLSGYSRISEAADEIDEHYREVGKLPEVLVHENGNLVGEVPFSVLVRENNSELLKKHYVPVRTISYQAGIDEIISSFSSSKHGKVVVLDKDKSVIGIIYSDDALALIGSHPASLYNFAGVSENERVFDSASTKVSHRYKWLILNLCTALLAASVVSLFEDTISQIVMLAVFMPIIAGMGGNAATQTLAVVVRGITMGEISIKNAYPGILKEVGAGLVNGIINGILVCFVAAFWTGNIMLGVVIGIAMVFNLIIAGLFGSLVPLILKSMGKDPATSATIFITTATDVFGFLVFLGLATLVLL